MNKCKDCKNGKPFKDIFTGKKRHLCSIGKTENIGYGDTILIVDGECEEFKENKNGNN